MTKGTEPRVRTNDLDEIESRAHEAWSEPPDRLIHAQLIGNDIPNLVAEVKRLRARDLQWEKSLNIQGDEFDVADLRAEVMRLRAAKGLCFYCGHEAVAHDSGRPICGRCNSRTMSVSTL